MNPTSTLSAILIARGLCSIFLYLKAKKDGRNPGRWFFIGLLFEMLGVIAYFVSRKRKKEVQQKKEALIKPTLCYSDCPWYYVDEMRNPIGPLSYSKISDLFKTDQIKETTLVWNEDLADWKPLKELFRK